MQTITFTEFRKNASGFFSAVEKGETIIVLRHGKPVAEIKPISAEIINLTPEVMAAAVSLLETSSLRAMDALHAACALVWGAGLFVSADTRQIAAAQKAGLMTKQV